MKKPNGYKPRLSAKRLQEWVNAQIDEGRAKAMADGMAAGLGVDAFESLKLLKAENNESRALIEACIDNMADTDTGKRLASELMGFISRPPAQLHLRPLKSDASPEASPGDVAVDVRSLSGAVGVADTSVPD